MIRVMAPSRLHFGLFGVPVAGATNAGERSYGGVGLMIDAPGVVVDVRIAESWRVEGPLASRAQAFAARFMQSLPEEQRRPFQLLIERAPPEHTGFGVGTQLGLAVAQSLTVAGNSVALPSTELAQRIGRGERSAIGIHGFDHGGLIADAGKLPGEAVSPLLAHVTLPTEWRVVLFAPSVVGYWHGDRERRALAAATPGDPNGLRKLAEEAILPAARVGDIVTFGEAVHEFNRKAGERFAAAQGGTYASPTIAELIAAVRTVGIRGVGQSSWGPTVFAIVPDVDTALALVQRFRNRVPVFVARISAGHTIQRGEPTA